MALDSLDPLTAPMPAPPVRQFSFTDFQTNNPTAPPPGDRLDAEIDRANEAVSDTIAWANVTLNTDGTLRDAIVGESNLQPDLFDNIANDAIAQVQPLVNQAAAYSASAGSSSVSASSSATSAASQAVISQGAAGRANNAQVAAEAARDASQGYADNASAAAGDAWNAGNDAEGAAALAQDYADVTQAWAEHMPDPIPPNILAVMGITGDHWSSRWWANQAAAAFGALTSLYLGAFPTPPTQTPTGQPIPIGAIYYNTVSGQPYVWNGTAWVPFYAPTKAVTLSLAYSANGSQTAFPLTTVDLAGNTYSMNATTPEPIEVWLNGVRLLLNQPAGIGDWNVNAASSTVTLTAAPRAGSIVQIDVLTPVSALQPSRVQTQTLRDFNIDPTTGNPGYIDGARTTFPLNLAVPPYDGVVVGSADELFVSLEGVPQQPSIDFSAVPGTGSITFNAPPLPGSRAWGQWYGPGTTSGGGTIPGGPYLPLSGGAVSGATTFGATLGVTGAATFGSTFAVIGNSTMTGSLIVGNAASTSILRLQGAANSSRALQFTVGASQRWNMSAGANAPTETGLNTGSNLRIDAYSDTGLFVNNLLEGTRSSGPSPMAPGNPSVNIAPIRQTTPLATRPNGIIGNQFIFPTDADTQPTTTLGANPLSVTSGSPTVTVTWTGACYSGGPIGPGFDVWVFIQGTVAVGGITPTGWFRVASIVDINRFTITWTSNATSTTTGGGSAVTLRPSYTTTTNWRQSGSRTAGSGFPCQDAQLWSIDPEFYSPIGTNLFPRYEQCWKWVVGPNDTSGLNNWTVAGVEWDFCNRGKDMGYQPDMLAAINGTVGFWCGATGKNPPAWSTGGGVGTNWGIVYAVFAALTERLGSYIGLSVQPCALVSAQDDPTGHGGVGVDIYGSYTNLPGNPFTTAVGTSTITVNAVIGTQNNGDMAWFPNVLTLAGVTFGGGYYAISNVNVANRTFTIQGTGTASFTGTGGGSGQWIAYSSLVPYAPYQIQGAFKHGLISNKAHIESGGIIETQPGNGILWSDGSGTASITSTAPSAGNIGISMLPAGTGTVSVAGTLSVVPGTVPMTTTTQHAFTAAASFVGTSTDTLTNLNQFLVNNDTINAAASGGLSGMYIGHTVGGAAVRGGRNALQVFINLPNKTGNTTGSSFYLAGGFRSQASNNDNGTAGTPHGDLFGAISRTNLLTGGTFWNSIVSMEHDVGIQAGASAAYKQGIKIVMQSDDAVRGSLSDYAIGIGLQSTASPTSPGFALGLAFVSRDGISPFSSTSTLIGAENDINSAAAFPAAIGVDLTKFVFGTAAFKSTGFQVDGSGNTTVARAGFNGTAPVAKPTVSGAKGSNAALASLIAALVSYGLITDSTTA